MSPSVSEECLLDLVFSLRVHLMDPKFRDKCNETRIEEMETSLREAEEALDNSVDWDDLMPTNLKPPEVER